MNRVLFHIIIITICSVDVFSMSQKPLLVRFTGDTIHTTIPEYHLRFPKKKLNDEFVRDFYNQIESADLSILVADMKAYQQYRKLDDWLYYQFVRSVAQAISPKSDNYYLYTLYKWYLLNKSGYDATLSLSKNHLLFYVQSEDNIYGIPYFHKGEKQYVCLNYHDYREINFLKNPPIQTSTIIDEGQKAFSYKIEHMPDFNSELYTDKTIQFDYYDKLYHFTIKLNPIIKNLFTNYPVPDFETYFNIPLSKQTYQSLIPELKRHIDTMSETQGIDYLMRFTRYGFLFENDQKYFGKEKRLSPEQTLLYEYSDCDDRAALFFYLVKELYNKPMIALLYPTHITIAVELEPTSDAITIEYQGAHYTVCEPTPQKDDLKIGELPKHLLHQEYKIIYAYHPQK